MQQNYLDLSAWKRRRHHDFFLNFDNPFFNICADVDITEFLAFTRNQQVPFFLASLFLSCKAANGIAEFRYRLRGDKVLVHDVIHAGSTVLNEDETFGFCYFDYSPNFGDFLPAAESRLAEYHASDTKLNPKDDRDDMLHYSVIPWVSFSSFSHARRFGTRDSVPRIVFGKYRKESDAVKLPVSVEVHHALMDGLHVGRFFSAFQEHLNKPETSLG